MKHHAILAVTATLSLILAVAAFPQAGGGQAQGGGQGRAGQQGQAQQQQATPAQPPGSMTGQVVSSTTGEPLRKVTLSLRPQGRGGTPATATSDAAGNFRFTTVDPGTYTLTGERAGYVRAAYGEDRVGGQARPIEVTTGKATTSIQIKLLPHSVIAGRVYDQDGDPIQNASVQAMRYSYPGGKRQLSTVQQATTNDLGEFRIPGLAPGRYYVNATDRGLLGAVQALLQGGGGPGGPGGPLGGPGGGRGNQGGRGAILDQLLGGGADANPEAYVTTYYPRAIEANGATPIDLVPGSEARGIDIGLLKARKYTITGVVENMPAAPAQPQNAQQGKGKQGKQGPGGPGGINLTLIPRSSSPQQPGIANILGGGGAAQVNANGTFEFRGVQPGAYYLMAQSRGPQQAQRLSARVPIDVGSSDLNNIKVRLTPPLAVTGKVAPEKADSTINFTSIRLNFTASAPQGPGGGRGGQGRIDIAADGKFQTELDGDSYNVEVAGAPSGYYLKAVKLSGREVPDNVLDLTFSGAALDIVLANDAGNITGTVQKSNGDPVQSARVTAVPINGSARRDLYKSVNSGTDGTFTISTLPPGSYKLYAWEEVEANAWMDADFRRPFESLGTNATIRDGAGPNVTLKVIGREQMVLAGVQ